MKLTTLSTAMILATIPMTGAFAAAMDRSGQPISAFLQPGNYFEAGISVLDPTVTGQEISALGGDNIDNMGSDYYFPGAALKFQVNDQFSVGFLYDQPFGAKAQYKGENAFVASNQDIILSSLPSITTDLLEKKGLPIPEGATSVKVDTQSFSFLMGYQPNANWNFYAGPVYQTIKADVSLRGSAYSAYNGYDAHIKENGDWGWLAGLAYQIPEIALKASLTYRSKIDYSFNADENLALADSLLAALPELSNKIGNLPPAEQLKIANAIKGLAAANNASGTTKLSTPQSVNFDFQTGIMEDTVAFANIRWVHWKDFAIQPYKFGAASQIVGSLVGKPNGFNLVEYSKDQWSISTGLGRKFTDQWAGNFSIGWDSGAGNPVTTLGPTKGYWSLGLGGQYSPAKDYFIQAGVRYFWLGDAKAQTGAQAGTSNYVATFDKNHALGYMMKIGYRF
ncbi:MULTISPECIES: OmpP1/FadL family transporter [unclassified Acinetobacter]|uniref:OmpP1/FadL family transporter n=1 Tax=unclassified Acinetobacter TaxID=196816 RepID=UPI0029348168|nr:MULTISPECIES: outer membrane protein transport protein [unclassified Acinetobacter]WOE32794.1 outer membrane protein transport protein [Acinetobacter sp. SAAs470]WOE38271.1 outer membrane protein transport protein [Acinetobacter sp. SAAs474]